MTSVLVISRYNEDISWCIDYKHTIIYNKGLYETIPSTLQSYVINVPNIGREAHTYLLYIIEHYDNLPDVIVFSQGMYTDHMSKELFNELFNIDINSYSKNLTNASVWGNYGNIYKFNISNWKGKITPTLRCENYGQWYERIFKTKFDDTHIHMYAGAIFSVGSNIIRKYSKEFYINLLNESELSLDSAPEAAHFMERTWSRMYTT
jgi:hypothetical protein